jgi:hypothetical protein
LRFWAPLLAPMLVHHGCQSLQCISLLGLLVVLGKMTRLPAIEPRVSGGCRLLWWPGCHLLLLRCRRGAIVLLLLLLLELWVIAPGLRRSTRLSRGWRVNHAVLQGSTTRTTSRGSWHCPLSFLVLSHFIGTHSALLVNSYAR